MKINLNLVEELKQTVLKSFEEAKNINKNIQKKNRMI